MKNAQHNTKTLFPHHTYQQNNTDVFIVDISTFEGPIDLLLNLAQTQKVDLLQISILKLVEQYLQFINKAQKLKLEIAAEYLLTATQLAYLKSALMLPKPPQIEENPQEIAAKLALQLKKLNAMKEAATQLLNRNLLNRDVFHRGNPETIILNLKPQYKNTLYDILHAYADITQKKHNNQTYKPKKRYVCAIKNMYKQLITIIPYLTDWKNFTDLISQSSDWKQKEKRQTITASGFAAILEMAREGHIDIKQKKPFKTIKIKSNQ